MKKIKSIAALVMLGIFKISMVAAQTVPLPPNPGLKDYSNGGGLAGLIGQIINLVLLITGSIAVLFIIIGGFQYILSGANEDLAKRGKTTVVNSIIGLVIILLSYTIVRVVFIQLTNSR